MERPAVTYTGQRKNQAIIYGKEGMFIERYWKFGGDKQR